MIVTAAGLLLLANHTVKFIWSPHTQIFNLLVPMLGVLAALQGGALATALGQKVGRLPGFAATQAIGACSYARSCRLSAPRCS